jgi:vacuolar protein sorting-associated protein 13A/C
LSNSSEEKYFKLRNNYGIIKIKFPSEQKQKQWLDKLKSRIFEMNTSYEVKKEQFLESKLKYVYDPNEIYFGASIVLNKINLNLYDDEFELRNNIFCLMLKKLNLKMKLREDDTEMELGMLGLQIYDNTLEPCFKHIIDSTDPDCPDLELFSIGILICDEISPRYKKVQMDFAIKIGYLSGIWNPNSIRKLLAFLAHHDIYRDKILREIQLPPNIKNEEKFVMPLDEEEVRHMTCLEANSIYIRVETKIKNVRIIWLQPSLRFMFMEARLGESRIFCDLYLDHMEIEGTLGNTQLFDLSNYPYTINNQDEFNPGQTKEILGFNQNSSLDFKYKSYSSWCPNYKDKNSAHCEVVFNSGRLTYIHELFFRFFNYLFEEFLGALGPSQEVRDYRDKKNQVPVRDKNDIEFMVIDVLYYNI